MVKNKVFYFGAVEGIREHLLRPNLSEAIGTPCPVANPTLAANEALINSSADCQRVALINFFKASRGQDEGQPVAHTINNSGAARQDRLGARAAATTCRSPTTSTTRTTRTRRSTSPPTARRPTAPKGRRRSTCSTSTCSRR